MSWIVYKGFQPGQLDFGWPVWTLIVLWLSVPVLFYFCMAHATYLWRVRQKRLAGPSGNDVVVIVLGDLGHSPRMAYHVRSLVKSGRFVHLCGYLESTLPDFLYDDDTVDLYEIPVIRRRMWMPYLVFAAFKVVAQCCKLTSLLSTVIDENTEYVLVQNPPSIPVLAIAVFLRKTICPHVKIVVDWHNLNFSILNLKYHNDNHPAVQLLRNYEKYMGKLADYHFTVTEKLKEFLQTDFGIDGARISVVHDRPGDEFVPLKGDKRAIVKELAVLDGFRDADKLIVSATSFTEDEDFGVLVEALKKLDSKLDSRVYMVVTGKGPLQKKFLDAVAQNKWSENLIIRNVWLPVSDYPKLLQVADAGVSLHYSSSGLDLPMKIVDLFGCGVPVVSMDFPALHELVTDQNGLVMKNNSDASELCDKMYRLLYEVDLKPGALRESARRWDQEWRNTKIF
ncbi:hypothetical protein KL928_002484 [Ogataea angusta]|uniref:Chitobiosyldiphosphodolichol beta-mannosyltransferase n=1 Tax=Pichia angusta TaxID=870730 RepID=A0AAN6DG04_PICAN|nr:uncharacterized protein KL928_002484 [Ogataea angusta]KAG7819810.1 hypothetical protein KL928_002484 [Ogataea angusta]